MAINIIDTAETVVFEYVKNRLEKTDTHITFTQEDVYTVWYSYILGNHKHLISTTLPDGMYYEVTYDEVRGKTYIDAYKKFDHIAMSNKEN